VVLVIGGAAASHVAYVDVDSQVTAFTDKPCRIEEADADGDVQVFVAAYAECAYDHTLTNDFDTALAHINTALDLYYDSVKSPFHIDPAVLAPLYVQRGQIHLLLYEWDDVLADYNTALSIDPEYADAYYYRGVLYYSVRFEREKAMPDFARYLELAPDGDLAEKAAQYLADIQAELKALER
jgi:tetratricopeptide (TPR) repeat protein